MNINSNNFILKPKNDYVFKKIFGDERNKDILIAFLKAVLKIDIEDVQILNRWFITMDKFYKGRFKGGIRENG